MAKILTVEALVECMNQICPYSARIEDHTDNHQLMKLKNDVIYELEHISNELLEWMSRKELKSIGISRLFISEPIFFDDFISRSNIIVCLREFQ